jgi:cyclic beta-1,2-glucan synthetase
MKYADPASSASTFALAATQLGVHAAALGHRGRGSAAVRAFGFARVLHRPFARLGSRRLGGEHARAAGLWTHGISGDLPSCWLRVIETNDLQLVRQVLRAQDYWR